MKLNMSIKEKWKISTSRHAGHPDFAQFNHISYKKQKLSSQGVTHKPRYMKPLLFHWFKRISEGGYMDFSLNIFKNESI